MVPKRPLPSLPRIPVALTGDAAEPETQIPMDWAGCVCLTDIADFYYLLFKGNFLASCSLSSANLRSSFPNSTKICCLVCLWAGAMEEPFAHMQVTADL